MNETAGNEVEANETAENEAEAKETAENRSEANETVENVPVANRVTGDRVNEVKAATGVAAVGVNASDDPNEILLKHHQDPATPMSKKKSIQLTHTRRPLLRTLPRFLP